jgi:molecular chaperone DnaK (HSP70)
MNSLSLFSPCAAFCCLFTMDPADHIPIVGIDLGTTTTIMSIYDPDDGAHVIENDRGIYTSESLRL